MTTHKLQCIYGTKLIRWKILLTDIVSINFQLADGQWDVLVGYLIDRHVSPDNGHVASDGPGLSFTERADYIGTVSEGLWIKILRIECVTDSNCEVVQSLSWNKRIGIYFYGFEGHVVIQVFSQCLSLSNTEVWLPNHFSKLAAKLPSSVMICWF